MYTYAIAETVLARLHEAESAQQAAFRGRLKHLKRLGIPQGVSPGRGVRVLYSMEQLFEWAFCLELAEFGIDPTVIVKLIKSSWDDEILPQFLLVQQDINQTVYFVAHPRFMAEVWNPQSKTVLNFGWIRVPKQHASDATLRLPVRGRAILIDISILVATIAMWCALLTDTNLEDHLGRDERLDKTVGSPTRRKGPI